MYVCVRVYACIHVCIVVCRVTQVHPYIDALFLVCSLICKPNNAHRFCCCFAMFLLVLFCVLCRHFIVLNFSSPARKLLISCISLTESAA